MKTSDEALSTRLMNWYSTPSKFHVKMAMPILVFACAMVGCSNGYDNQIQARKRQEEIGVERCKSGNIEFNAGTSEAFGRAEEHATLSCIGDGERNTNSAPQANSSSFSATAQPSEPNPTTALYQDLSACAALGIGYFAWHHAGNPLSLP